MKKENVLWWLRRLFFFFVVGVPLACIPTDVSAACSDSKVKRLSRQGKTVAAIARTCGLDASDVREILEPDDEEEDENGGGLGRGTPLAPCGCWGPVSPGYREPNVACRSGYATVRMCPQTCPAGGYAWQGVCV